MCAGAIVLARLDRVVWGVDDPRRGGALSCFRILDDARLNHRPEVLRHVLEAPCRDVLQAFFRARREGAPDPD